MKEYDKNEEFLYLKLRDVNKLYGPAMLQNLPVDSSQWVENTSTNKNTSNTSNRWY